MVLSYFRCTHIFALETRNKLLGDISCSCSETWMKWFLLGIYCFLAVQRTHKFFLLCTESYHLWENQTRKRRCCTLWKLSVGVCRVSLCVGVMPCSVLRCWLPAADAEQQMNCCVFSAGGQRWREGSEGPLQQPGPGLRHQQPGQRLAQISTAGIWEAGERQNISSNSSATLPRPGEASEGRVTPTCCCFVAPTFEPGVRSVRRRHQQGEADRRDAAEDDADAPEGSGAVAVSGQVSGSGSVSGHHAAAAAPSGPAEELRRGDPAPQAAAPRGPAALKAQTAPERQPGAVREDPESRRRRPKEM